MRAQPIVFKEVSEDLFAKNISQLQVKWVTGPEHLRFDSELGRDLFSLLSNPDRFLQPLVVATICDDIKLFQKHFQEGHDNALYYLDLSLLFGAKNLGDYLIQKEQVDLEEYTELVPMLAASGNLVWLKEVCHKLKLSHLSESAYIYTSSDEWNALQQLSESL